MITSHLAFICPTCGQTFKKNINYQKYCSKECQVQFRNKKIKEKERETERLAGLVGICPECKQTFPRKDPRRKFCCDKCKGAYYSKSLGKNARIRAEKRCLICGKNLINIRRNVCDTSFCKSKRAYQRQIDKQERHLSKKRTPKLTRKIKARIKEVKEINDLRQSMGLRPIEVKIIPCSLCAAPFYSEDAIRVKTCNDCKEATTEYDADSITDGGVKRNRKWVD